MGFDQILPKLRKTFTGMSGGSWDLALALHTPAWCSVGKWLAKPFVCCLGFYIVADRNESWPVLGSNLTLPLRWQFFIFDFLPFVTILESFRKQLLWMVFDCKNDSTIFFSHRIFDKWHYLCVNHFYHHFSKQSSGMLYSLGVFPLQ